MPLKQIKKRDGSIVDFNAQKITDAIEKALTATNAGDGDVARRLAERVIAELQKRFASSNPSVEDVQDIVEKILIEEKYPETAKAYILYRQKRADVREAKTLVGVHDDLKLSLNAVKVLQKRYLLRNEKGEITETPAQLFRRVAHAIAAVDGAYGASKAEIQKTEDEFYALLSNLEFLPNTPTLMNAGTALGQLSACFVIPVEDSINGIFDALKHMALIHQSGGGTGFSFSRLRPKGDIVQSTKGVASGPVSFMRIFDAATDVVKQGGKRRGANMGILHVSHPDIIEFITAKEKENALANFNISVAVDEAFMRKVAQKERYALVNPRTKEKVKEVNAADLFDLIVTMAWRTGDPGMLFIDEINRRQQTPHVGKIEATNPCGEQPLLPYESCNLGSINLAKMVDEKKKAIDWPRLGDVVHTAIHFLDNVIDANRYPLPEIEKITKANRKIGLGVMGFAELLIKLSIPYDSEEALAVVDRLMKFIDTEAKKKSMAIAEERGSFPHFSGSRIEKKYPRMRNATATTIAPTGTISIIAGCTSGIEPLFAIAFVRNVMEGTELLEVNSLFELIAKEQGFYSRALMARIARAGSVQGVPGVPKNVQRIFVTAHDITPEWHVRMQAAFQKHTDNAVSKTVNLPSDATREKVKNAYLLAHKLKCKGITVYRYGSKKEQVLYLGNTLKESAGEAPVSADSEYSGGSPCVLCSF